LYSSCGSENILSSIHSFKFYKYQTAHTFSLALIPIGIRHRATKNIVDMLWSVIGISTELTAILGNAAPPQINN